LFYAPDFAAFLARLRYLSESDESQVDHGPRWISAPKCKIDLKPAVAPTIELLVPDQLQKNTFPTDSDRATFVVRSDAMGDQSAAGDCKPADRSSSLGNFVGIFVGIR
jgi:hypothetical protein